MKARSIPVHKLAMYWTRTGSVSHPDYRVLCGQKSKTKPLTDDAWPKVTCKRCLKLQRQKHEG